MSRLLILGDTHFGARSDSIIFMEYFDKFYRNVLFPYIDANPVDVIIQLGDLFDRRKYINFNTLNNAKKVFFEPLVERNIRLITLIGNHDIFFRNTLRINSSSLLLSEYENIHVVSSPEQMTFDDITFDFIPWICDENEKEITEFIKTSNSSFCFGHFELAGFEIDRGNYCHGGMDSSLLSRYEQVISGHFHHKSQKGNILYTGVHGQMSWADWNDPKGFHVFDTKTREFEFIENPNEIYEKVKYNDDDMYFDEVQNADYSGFAGKYIKVVVEKKNNAFLFDTMIENLNKANPIDITIVEDFSVDLASTESDESVDQAEDTMAIINKVVDDIEVDLSKTKLKNILREVYNEALAVES